MFEASSGGLMGLSLGPLEQSMVGGKDAELPPFLFFHLKSFSFYFPLFSWFSSFFSWFCDFRCICAVLCRVLMYYSLSVFIF